MILPIVLFSVAGLAFIVLGTMMNKKSNTGNPEANKMFVALMRLLGLAILVVGNAYAVIDSKGWTTENSKSFYMIAVLVPCLVMALLGVRFLRLNARGIARTGAIVWTLVWFAMTGYGFIEVNNSGQGWTPESQKKILDKVTPYDRMCYLEQIMDMFDSPEEYNIMAVKKEDEIAARMEKNCKVCDLGEAEEVEGLPDDF